jgi:Mrp family chromosome partitioning ATPase/capsular polysaccharide biosynthesis protein
VVTLLAGAGSFLLAIRQTPRYEAVAQVLLRSENVPSIVTDSANPNAGTQPDRIAATQAQLARVPEVARRALAIAGRRDRGPTDLLRSSSVSSNPTTDLLSFTVEDGDREVAETLATAYARAYVRYRYAVDAEAYLTAGRQLERRLAELRSSGRVDSPLYDELAARQQQLESIVTLQTANARLVRPAADAAQTQPRPARALAIGLPAGLLLGLVLALLSHVLDTRVRTPDEVEDALGIGSLGWIPRPPRRFRHRVVMLSDPTSAYGEAYTSVRTSLDLARRVNGGDVLLVTTVARRTPGVASVAVANLAVAFARAGLHVVLVDLDLRQPAIGRLFDLAPRFGITEVMLGSAGVEDVLQPVSVQSKPSRPARRGWALDTVEFGGTLRVLPVARRPGNPTDVLATRGLAVVLEQLRETADVVLIAAPPVLEGSDTAAVTMHVDALAVIVEIGHDRRGQLARARRQLESTPATSLGFVGTGKWNGERSYTAERSRVGAGMEAVR